MKDLRYETKPSDYGHLDIGNLSTPFRNQSRAEVAKTIIGKLIESDDDWNGWFTWSQDGSTRTDFRKAILDQYFTDREGLFLRRGTDEYQATEKFVKLLVGALLEEVPIH